MTWGLVMSSLFDSSVSRRRNETPWARMNFVAFARDMATNGFSSGAPVSNAVELTCTYRHDVSSGFWWAIRWTCADGERRLAESQEFDLCLWRAAEMELEIEARVKSEKADAVTTPPGA